MSAEDFESEGRFKRKVIGGVIVVALIGGIASFFFTEQKPAPKKAKDSGPIVVSPIPPPPPPPPPPPEPEPEPPEPEEEEMIKQEEIVENPEPEPSPEQPPAGLDTGLTGDGPNTFGLTGGNGNGGSGRIGGNGRSAGRFDRQALGIQNTLVSALKRNDTTRKSVFSGKIAVWATPDGRITRVKLDGSAGSSAVDQAIRDQLVGLQLPDVTGMPMPIHLRLSGRKPTP